MTSLVLLWFKCLSQTNMLSLTVNNIIEKQKTISKSEIQFFKREKHSLKHFLKEKNSFSNEIQFPFKIPS